MGEASVFEIATQYYGAGQRLGDRDQVPQEQLAKLEPASFERQAANGTGQKHEFFILGLFQIEKELGHPCTPGLHIVSGQPKACMQAKHA
jgi:hypothetical protein